MKVDITTAATETVYGGSAGTKEVEEGLRALENHKGRLPPEAFFVPAARNTVETPLESEVFCGGLVERWTVEPGAIPRSMTRPAR